MQSAQPILRKFPQVEACLRCSAKRLVNVGDVFHTALKAVVNPVAPLFDPQAEGGDGAMTPMCIRALKRIFVMNDHDKVRSTWFSAWLARTKQERYILEARDYI